VLIGLILSAALGWWRADSAAAFVIVYHGVREVFRALRETIEEPMSWWSWLLVSLTTR
jgi:divalent metal cation (Fe/Co/Zn/Cd) transporter